MLKRVPSGWLFRSIEAAKAFEKANPVFVKICRENWKFSDAPSS